MDDKGKVIVQYSPVKCDICSNIFHPTGGCQYRCSKECSRAYKRRNVWKNDNGERNCKFCGINFIAKVVNARCCSRDCALAFRLNEYFSNKKWSSKDHYTRRLKAKPCYICKKEFLPGYRASMVKTCSKVCRKIWHKKRIDKWKSDPRVISRAKKTFEIYLRKNPQIKLYNQIRYSIFRALNMPKGNRPRTKTVIDYSMDVLKSHIEKQFKPGMTWDNHTINGWHIDHIKPLSSFIFLTRNGKVDIKEMKKAIALSNLQPLWAAENIRKGGINRPANYAY